MTLFSIGMLLWGIHMFTYRGDFTKLMSVTGEYSLLLFLPTFLIGMILTGIGIGRIKKVIK